MKRKSGEGGRRRRNLPMLLSIVLVFIVMAGAVFWVSQKLSREMSAAAVQNLSSSLDLVRGTIESMLNSEAEFQALLARDVASAGDPEEYIRTYKRNDTMVKLSLVKKGESAGVSSTGEVFHPEELSFSGGEVAGLPLSQSYVNYMGTWAYTMRCPVEKDGEELGDLYVEYVYDALERFLPDDFYNRQAMLYIMDAGSQRFVLKPKGMGQRSAGHVDLEDFYRANDILDPDLRARVEGTLQGGENILFYHDIQKQNSLNYMWSVNDGCLYLVGYVPVSAIQQEGDTVNWHISFVVVMMLLAFLLCCSVYFINYRQQDRVRREREQEREVHNRQLAEALHAAQLASHSKTTFLSNMSHDIRTPMNAVLGFTTLLNMDAEDPEKVREYTRKITASGQHLLSLINDVLDVSKIESGKVVLNLSEFDLSDLVNSVDAIIKPMADGKGQDFSVEITGVRHETLIGDQTRLDQVLINLLSNAVKYTQQGGKISLRIIGLTREEHSRYQRLRIEVEDNGYGMTPEFLTTIFDAFTRAENSTTNKVQGTGLGMAITKSIVELMGGSIQVESQVGEGSLFRVELELRVPEGAGETAFWQERGISRALALGGREEEIRARLECTGLELKIFASGPWEEALSQVESAWPQLILWDWDAAGDEDLLLRLREKRPPETPLLILSEGHRVPALEPGELLLPKPFFVSALRERLQELWDGPQRGGSREEEEASLRGIRFLAAEDNEINAEILTELLELEGAVCQVEENGQLVLERFERSQPGEFDAILMDVQMPVMNGYEATRAIRALPRPDAGTIPIIAMTANAFAEDEKAALDAGMDAHVPKPIDIALLKRTVRGFVERE